MSDVDAGDTITARLTLSIPSAGALTTAVRQLCAGNRRVDVTGSLASVNAALASVAFVPAPNSNAGVTIATHIEDASGVGPANGTISLTVTPVNDAPVGVKTAPGSATEGRGTLNSSGGNGASGNVLTNDTDIDTLNSALTVIAHAAAARITEGAERPPARSAGRPTAQRGTLTLGANGAYTYTVDENDRAPCRRSRPARRSSTASTTRSATRSA